MNKQPRKHTNTNSRGSLQYFLRNERAYLSHLCAFSLYSLLLFILHYNMEWMNVEETPPPFDTTTTSITILRVQEEEDE